MSEKYIATNPKVAVGVNFHHTDGQGLSPTSKQLDGSEIEEWFFSHPEFEEEVNSKILACRVNGSQVNADKSFRPTFGQKIVEHAVWKPEVYYNLAISPGGGAAALLDEPPRFVLQTPLDGGPFFSLAMSKKGNCVKGIYAYDSDEFEPSSIGTGELSYSGWRSRGFQIVNMPQAILRAHSTYVSRCLSQVIDEIKAVEHALLEPPSCDLTASGRTLHSCNARIIDLERRSRFEQTIISAIETMVSNSRDGRMPWPAIAPQKSALEARGFDFESLPRRIDNARNTIAGIIQQHNERMHLEIADATKRMTEIALSDNASMKTIAILTMLFLPGTAVASFFSMAMFNWSAVDGNQIVSKWLWVYFVIAVPLTAIVVLLWWLWGSQATRRRRRILWSTNTPPLPSFEDIELVIQRDGSGNEVRTETALPKT